MSALAESAFLVLVACWALSMAIVSLGVAAEVLLEWVRRARRWLGGGR